MKFRRLWAVARKEFIHLMRDPRSLGLGILIPMIMLLLFGYALTLDVDRVPVIIWNQSQDNASRDFVSMFQGSRYFDVIGFATNYDQMERAIDTREALAALVIPADFSRHLDDATATAQWIVDGSDSNTAELATGYADSVTQAYATDILLKKIE